MSDAAEHRDTPRGTGLLPRPLSAAELDATPVLASVDALAIDDLTDDEAARFLAAIEE